MAKTGRPKKEIPHAQLKAFMRLKPSLQDTANFFECSVDTIERFIRREFKASFADFREQNMVHTRFSLIRKAIQKGEGGDNVMLIFCLKNLCGWKDRYDQEVTLGASDSKPKVIVTLPSNGREAKK